MRKRERERERDLGTLRRLDYLGLGYLAVETFGRSRRSRRSQQSLAKPWVRTRTHNFDIRDLSNGYIRLYGAAERVRISAFAPCVCQGLHRGFQFSGDGSKGEAFSFLLSSDGAASQEGDLATRIIESGHSIAHCHSAGNMLCIPWTTRSATP